MKKSPFDKTFVCPKCSEILFTKITYSEKTNTPQVEFTCPKKHKGITDIFLFFDLFYSSNQELENDLSHFEEELDKDIENYRKKKLEEAKNAEEAKKNDNSSQSKSKSKEKIKQDDKEDDKEKEKEKEEEKNENEENKENSEIIKEDNNKLFKELEKCNNIKFSLFTSSNIKENNNDKEKNNIKKNNYTKINPNTNDTNKIIGKSKEKKEIAHKIANNINIIKKIHSSEKEEKFKEEKFLCEAHNKSHFIAYCLSCKKNICKKCMKARKHKCKMFKNIKIKEKNLNELNKLVGQCQERLNKFESKNKLLIESLNKKDEKSEKIILFIMSSAFIEINRDYLNDIKAMIKNYNNCLKNRMLNYEIITSIKNIKLENNIIIPNNIQELISIIKDYKEYLFEKNIVSDSSPNFNKYLLFETFNEIIKKDSETDDEKGIIKFGNIIEDEKFRNLINLSELKDDELSEKNEGDADEKEVHQVEKIEYDDYEEGEDLEESPELDEEDLGIDNEYEEYEDDINNDEDENNFGDDEDGFKDDEDK